MANSSNHGVANRPLSFSTVVFKHFSYENSVANLRGFRDTHTRVLRAVLAGQDLDWKSRFSPKSGLSVWSCLAGQDLDWIFSPRLDQDFKSGFPSQPGSVLFFTTRLIPSRFLVAFYHSKLNTAGSFFFLPQIPFSFLPFYRACHPHTTTILKIRKPSILNILCRHKYSTFVNLIFIILHQISTFSIVLI